MSAPDDDAAWRRPLAPADWDCAARDLDVFLLDVDDRWAEDWGGGDEARRVPSHCTIRLFGIADGGVAVYATVRDYCSWLLVSVPATWRDDSHVITYADALRRRVDPEGAEARVSNDVDRGAGRAWGGRSARWASSTWHSLADQLMDARIVRRTPLYGWTPDDGGACGDGTDAFVRLTFETNKAMRTYAEAIRMYGAPTVADDGVTVVPGAGESGVQFLVAEDHWRASERAIHDGGWTPGAWVRLKAGAYRRWETTAARTHAPERCLDVTVRMDGVAPLVGRTDVPPYRVMYFDIECTNGARGDRGAFPEPDVHDNCVIQFGAILVVSGAGGGAPVERQTIFVLRDCDEIAGVDVRAFDDETSMMLAIQRYWTTEADPDVVVGYNIWRFDLRYLAKRAEHLGVGDQFLRLSKARADLCRLDEATLDTKAYGFNKYARVDTPGAVQLDLYVSLARDPLHKLRSYTLGDVSAHFLGGDTKDDLKPRQIFEYHERGTARDRATVARYCMQDVRLCVRLADRLKTLPALIEMGRVTRVTMTQLLARGQQVKVASLLTAAARRRNVAITAPPDIALFAMLHNDPRARPLRLRPGEAPYTGAELLLPLDELLLRRNRTTAADAAAPPLSKMVDDAPLPAQDDVEAMLDGMATLGIDSLPSGWKRTAPMELVDDAGNASPAPEAKRARTFGDVLTARSAAAAPPPKTMRRLGYVDQNTDDPRLKADAKYAGATVLTPLVGFYDEVVATLDFVSLYPSIIIAFNLCYTTMIRDAAHWDRLAPSDYHERVIPHASYGPLTVRFVRAHIRRGLLPDLLTALLAERAAVRAEQKKVQKTDPRYDLFEGRQLALKISANSVYGFSGATVGRFPCVPVAAFVTGQGRDGIMFTKTLLEREESAIGVQVIYGDTDSVMIRFRGRVTFQESFAHAARLADRVTRALDRPPMRLLFEKCYHPYDLHGKKRYLGRKFMAPPPGAPPPSLALPADAAERRRMMDDQRDVKGLQTVRRDGCLLIPEIGNAVIDTLLFDAAPDAAAALVRAALRELVARRTPLEKLVISQKLSKADSAYDALDKNGKPKAVPAHVAVARRRAARDPGDAPYSGDRVPYVCIDRGRAVWTERQRRDAKMCDRAEDPAYVVAQRLAIDWLYYVDRQLEVPLMTLFAHHARAGATVRAAFADARAALGNRRSGTTPIGDLMARAGMLKKPAET